MPADNYALNNVNIALGGVVPVTGSFTSNFSVDYTNPAAPTIIGTPTGSASIAFGGIGLQNYSNFTITTTGNAAIGYTYTITASSSLTNATIVYNGQNPSTASVTVSALGLGALSNPAAAITVQAVPCFAAGTLIRTSRGEVAVENLQVGDMVETTSGKSRRIIWLGNSNIDIRIQAHPIAYQPVRISADAFGPGMPYRDLTVSPGHGICVHMLDEVIVPPIVLVNGTTINQLDEDHVSYWHVELDAHDIMYANGLPAESYMNVGNRGFFDELGDDPVRTLADYCRPYVNEGVLVTAMREQLKLRAEQLGWRRDVTPFAGLHVEADGARVDAVIDGLTARFELPADAEDVWLVSAASVPAHVLESHDTRRLGVLLRGLRVEDRVGGREIALDDASLCVGFHAAEASADDIQRWTTGRARLPAALWAGSRGDLAIRIELADVPLPKWVAPARPETTPARDGKHLSLVAA